jgi:putative transposase
MDTSKASENQPIPLEEQLVGINAKTAPYPAARSWSGGRRRILGKGALESYTYHVMSRTCKKKMPGIQCLIPAAF